MSESIPDATLDRIIESLESRCLDYLGPVPVSPNAVRAVIAAYREERAENAHFQREYDDASAENERLREIATPGLFASVSARAEKAEADLAALRAGIEALHQDDGDGFCNECGATVPECPYIALLSTSTDQPGGEG